MHLRTWLVLPYLCAKGPRTPHLHRVSSTCIIKQGVYRHTLDSVSSPYSLTFPVAVTNYQTKATSGRQVLLASWFESVVYLCKDNINPASLVRKQKEKKAVPIDSSFLWLHPADSANPHSSGVFPLNSGSHLQMCSELCLLGDPKSSPADEEDGALKPMSASCICASPNQACTTVPQVFPRKANCSLALWSEQIHQKPSITSRDHSALYCFLWYMPYYYKVIALPQKQNLRQVMSWT